MKTQILHLLASIAIVSFCAACSSGGSGGSSSNTTASTSQAMLQTPVVSSSIPASPSSNLNPVISGTTAPNASVQLFADSACKTTPLIAGQADEAGQFNLPVAVTANTTVSIYALATSSDGRVSLCSPTSVTYFADTTPPTPLIFTQVASTSDINAPIIEGNAQPNVTVFIYTDALCTQATGQVTSGSDGYFEFHAIVAANSVSVFYGQAEDQAGNISTCSTSNISYSSIPVSTPPASTPETAPVPTFGITNNLLALGESFPFQDHNATSALVVFQLYSNANCAGTPIAQETASPNSVGQGTDPNADEVYGANTNIDMFTEPVGTHYYSANAYIVYNNSTAETSQSQVSGCTASFTFDNPGPTPPTPEGEPAPGLTIATATANGIYASSNEPVLTLSTQFQMQDSQANGVLIVFQAYNNANCAGTPSAQTTVPFNGGSFSYVLAQGHLSMTAPIAGLNYYSANEYVVYTNGSYQTSVSQTSSCSGYVVDNNPGAPDAPMIMSSTIGITTSPQATPTNQVYLGSYTFIGRTSPNALYTLYSLTATPCAPNSNNIVGSGTADQNGYFTYTTQVTGPISTYKGSTVVQGAPSYIQTSAFVSAVNQVETSSCVSLPLQ